MVSDIMLSLLLFSSICGIGLAIIAVEYLDNVNAREASLMKYGVCIQIWGFMALCVLRIEYQQVDMLIFMMPMLGLVGAGIFMLGAISVAKAMAQSRLIFATLAFGIQMCVVAFLVISASLVP